MKQKTDFNNWSISYLKDIYQCSKCKKRNTIVLNNNSNISNNNKIPGSEKVEKKNFQNCLYCGNPNYV